MSEIERKTIEIPEISRVEGHSAVTVDIKDGKVCDVKLEVFEGTRFFERIVLNHQYDEIPHITSRVCAICSTGHVLAAISAVERIFQFAPSKLTMLLRELMHLGMIIESHATHICALALPDFLGARDLQDFAVNHQQEFDIWMRLRQLGATVQTAIGGRPFHPVNLHVGKLSRIPTTSELSQLRGKLDEGRELAQKLCQAVNDLEMPFGRTAKPRFLALIPRGTEYGYFGDTVRCTDGWEKSIEDYREYLSESVVAYSHAKRSNPAGGPLMVGSLARLHFFADRLGTRARSMYERSPLVKGVHNTIYNNLAQAIEIIEAVDRSIDIIDQLNLLPGANLDSESVSIKPGRSAGAVECPRGTLYHYYELDAGGRITAADMVTPSAQNSGRIELDIRHVVDELMEDRSEDLEKKLETLIRAYDPCNTCATHMVKVRWATQ